MGLQRTSEPSVEPVTLDEAKLHLRIDGTSAEDTYVTALIKAARQVCETRTGRTLITSTWKFVADSFDEIATLPMSPVTSVTSLKYYDSTGTQQTLDPSLYRADLVSIPARVETTDSWPVTDGRQAGIEVVYVAGYGAAASNVPQVLKQWILLAVGDMYTNRNRSRADRYPALPQTFAENLLDGDTTPAI